MARKQDLRGTSVDLARLLGITDRRVRQLVNDGIVSRQPEGDYLLPEAIAEYYAFKYKPDEAVDYMEEKALHEKTKRELAELELARRRNEVHDAEDVQIVMLGHFGSMETVLNWRTLEKHNLTLVAQTGVNLDLRGAQQIYDSSTGAYVARKVKCVVRGITKKTELGKLDVGTTIC